MVDEICLHRSLNFTATSLSGANSGPSCRSTFNVDVLSQHVDPRYSLQNARSDVAAGGFFAKSKSEDSGWHMLDEAGVEVNPAPNTSEAKASSSDR